MNKLLEDEIVETSELEDNYVSIPLKPAFTVQATYKFIGKMKPRQLPLDE